MDYSPWSEREIWPVSPKLKKWPRPPKLVCMHLHINPYLFLIPIRLNFLMTMDYSSISETSETRVTTPTKIGVHALDINPYLNEFFEPIPID